jgi:hypothetical protein
MLAVRPSRVLCISAKYVWLGLFHPLFADHNKQRPLACYQPSLYPLLLAIQIKRSANIINFNYMCTFSLVIYKIIDIERKHTFRK